jgi:hypothetical protein
MYHNALDDDKDLENWIKINFKINNHEKGFKKLNSKIKIEWSIQLKY